MENKLGTILNFIIHLRDMDEKRRLYVSQKANDKFLKLLLQARLDAALSRSEVAEKIGKHPSYIAKIESGKVRLYAHVFISLFYIYKKPLKYYFDAFGEPKRKKKK